MRRIQQIKLLLIFFYFSMWTLQFSAADTAASVWDGTLRRVRVPVLMYHYIDDLPANADDIRRGLTVAPDLFAAHLDYLRTEAYQTINFATLETALMTGTALPARPVILTFDDSYENHYTTAFPLLQQHAMIGTFYVITAALDENRIGYMTWPQAAQMAQAGMEIASHTKNHPDLRNRTYEYLVYEILGSMESIHAYTGQMPVSFAYPVGRYDVNTLAAIGTMPPLRAVTTQPGIYVTTDNRYELPRLRMNPDTSVYGLSQLLNQ